MSYAHIDAGDFYDHLRRTGTSHEEAKKLVVQLLSEQKAERDAQEAAEFAAAMEEKRPKPPPKPERIPLPGRQTVAEFFAEMEAREAREAEEQAAQKHTPIPGWPK
ncbi:hypothetical protein [Actinomadura sp. SCN-SB]|uniref:hypothetical protein n=1 Tax=Actinomadura sp. SCN-SB TaxID=3373092 RepID=UPI00374FE7F2